ncbi:PhzF family phenazine biosynthesis protein [Noviherbaspirillum sp. CPCC 100848]|uniref:PhzF family phenazine biosynthesis protein n=1 Tax=Noviherbaspirillum album TaxID=3080276 RepID=A0ABU6J803_9BURK|nr:PhzF family phenazine biosynthesis protein [Noviherbaspirillum sp. CPCC 100848]MEC4719655.1 PhzF family phenazine biosynthesis protein [Noviherbaspirillum sp. CPCC 100848]
MIQRRFKQVDVFTAIPYQGNPVAVVLDGDGLTTEQMQAIARWTNLSETTFVCEPTTPEADYRLRIFCPGSELPFAGHPTIGTAHALLASGYVPRQPGVLVQECGVGLVRMRTGGDDISIALPRAHMRSVDASARSMVEQAIGAPLLETPVAVDLGIVWLTGQVASGELLRSLKPSMEGIAAAALQVGTNGITLFGLDGDTPEVRSFAPHEGTPEDPVCGSGNGAVAFYLRERRGPRDYRARQGRCIGRDGHIRITHADDTIWLGGQAVSCIEGSIIA